jgi:hypothetical protein
MCTAIFTIASALIAYAGMKLYGVTAVIAGDLTFTS